MHLELISVVVDEYDPAIDFFVGQLGFELVEDSPSTTNDGRPKRWVVIRPPGATTGVWLARADGEAQRSIVGQQHGGRVGFFLRVDDFDAAYERIRMAGVVTVCGGRNRPGHTHRSAEIRRRRRPADRGRDGTGDQGVRRVPYLARGGGKVDDREVLAATRHLLDCGAAGIVFGRNIFQDDDPAAMAAALRALVHDDTSVEKAAVALGS